MNVHHPSLTLSLLHAEKEDSAIYAILTPDSGLVGTLRWSVEPDRTFITVLSLAEPPPAVSIPQPAPQPAARPPQEPVKP